MKRWRTLLIVLLSASAGAVCASCIHLDAFLPKGPVPVGAPTPAPEGEGWIDLLDETHAPRWKNITDDKEIFEIADGMLHIHGRTFLPLRYVGLSEPPIGDFELHLEYKLAKGCNSGVFLRIEPNDPLRRGFEIQVLDDFGQEPTKHTSGAVYDVVTPMFNLSRPAGEWNSYDITVVGDAVTVVMNGWKVIDTDFAKMGTPLGKFAVPYKDLPKSGMLALQDHGGEVWYRNIRLKPLEPAAP